MSSSPDAWPIHTARLRVRPCAVDDLDAVWAYRQLPEVNEWLGRAPATRDAFHATYSEPDRLAMTYVIELRGAELRIIGDIMIHIEDGWAQAEVLDAATNVQAELGWALDPVYTRQGYAFEAVRAVIDTCFGALGLRRVHAGCFTANEPSWRLMEKLGMRREEDSRKSGLHRSGEWMDGLNYGLLAEEWPRVAAS
ncbi:GNAT family protein [Microbacterium istanbulense]|uniref:GNAT family protein n=1 Tax=Microbacterium istanbulense TaxID=3122049 RepID=A0ABU8LJH4_9MICO